MAPRPTGTVTFLFTDIEGSTQLWENHAAWMEKAHARQEAILREAFAAHGGYPYKMIGDAFQVAFASAPAAVAAAADAQRALAAEPWGERAMRVRMALHTGETEERGDDYVGPILNRVARLMSAAHGGQVLVSQTTFDLVRDRLPSRIGVRDLGERRLRDLNRPERIHQLVVPGLDPEFPPLKTLDALPNNLPVQLTHFIGREQTIAEVQQALTRARLVTLTGAGGSGKTRLSLQTGSELLERFAHGVWFVELAPVTDERGVPQAVATALGVQEVAGRSVLDAVSARVADEERLVILDNCEHVLRAAAEVASALLRASPRSRVLVTSREPLRIAGESTYRVPSLETPEPRDGSKAALSSSEAVRLFADRASSAAASFALTDANVRLVADICRRLDGIPLAIELAAARVGTLSLERIAERLSDRFRLLARGDRLALPRHQTLRALIDWSHEILTEPERTLLRRLAVFAGGWSMDAAEAVCAGGNVDRLDVLDLLTNLVDKSLAVLEPGGERYRLLETIREYALERLQAADEEAGVRERHLEYYLALAEASTGTTYIADTRTWRAVDADYENLMAVHGWCDRAPDHVEQGLRLVVALGHYWRHRGHLEQGLRLTLEALARGGGEGHRLLRCKALYEVARFTFSMGHYPESEAAARESVAIAREVGANAFASLALRYLAGFEAMRGNHSAWKAHCEEAIALARGLDDRMTFYAALQTMGELHRLAGELDLAGPVYEEVLTFHRSIQDPIGISIQLNNLAMLHVSRGAPDQAIALLEEALAITASTGLKMAGQVALDTCAGLAAARGEWVVAARLFGASEVERLRIDVHRDPPDAAFLMPLIARAREALGEGFTALEAEGRALAYEEALTEARRWVALLR